MLDVLDAEDEEDEEDGEENEEEGTFGWDRAGGGRVGDEEG